MISQDVVLVRYGEIALKESWTRQSWERILKSNIAFCLHKAGVDHRISGSAGRIFIHSTDVRAAGIATQIFGVVSASSARTVPPNLDDISRAAVQTAENAMAEAVRSGPVACPDSAERSDSVARSDSVIRSDPAIWTFAIRPRRFGVPFSSGEIGRRAGEAVRLATGAAVNLNDPQLEIFIEARRERAYIFTDVVPGLGGLPLGSQGKMLALISGGIDSPVAAWMMMRRGCPVSLLHFDSRPFADSIDQSKRCAEILAEWSCGRKINFITIPIKKGIEKIQMHHPRATCILCRRLMYRIAAQVMEREEALGLVTGYSLGQVASQTAENILAEQAAIGVPVYHPLIAMDKLEIINLARKIGTYDVTAETKPCTAVPSKPMTRARREEILQAEEELDLVGIARSLAAEATEIGIGDCA
ncbi:tRNA uracil 4-sulfurtransferase ThiI [Methanothrix sp.]|jgi:thiamine biosynthesis protein ThiI|uniref:tRNA uracil 4-sulfurtransferase ThiI n=1 Tax=Methanothrix sp. TaxID=90426 RepID=UPI001BD3F94E